MANSNFIDYVKVYCRSGRGGKGAVGFRREKHVPKGGPDGGDGGRGGNIILRGNSQLWTLLHLKYQKHIKAQSGKHGAGARCSGAQGKDVIIEVPIGTVAKVQIRRKVNQTKAELIEITEAEWQEDKDYFQEDFEDEDDDFELIAENEQETELNPETVLVEEITYEIIEEGQEIVMLAGGRGGLGNHNFKSATNQAPRYAQPGEDAMEAIAVLELKVLADVGLVGFPNAGKSTLLSVLSAARPEIADYPFTTLVPNLGVVAYRDYKSFVMADIPGIIEGAAEGRGLGIRFLRHIERNSVLLFMVSAESDDIKKDFRTLLHELEKYNPELLDKRRLLAITKSDLLDEELKELIKAELPQDVPFIFISAVAQQGLLELKDMIWKAINE